MTKTTELKEARAELTKPAQHSEEKIDAKAARVDKKFYEEKEREMAAVAAMALSNRKTLTAIKHGWYVPETTNFVQYSHGARDAKGRKKNAQKRRAKRQALRKQRSLQR
jgi:hypothetical protein